MRVIFVSLTLGFMALFGACATPLEAKAPTAIWNNLPEESFKPMVNKPSVPKQSSVTHTYTKIEVKATTNPKRYALRKIGAFQFNCLNKLWERESGWNHRAMNKYSGAYGIPQALPGKKMASAGADWKTNPITQVKWGLSYIKNRYGTACNAWNYWQTHHWY